MNILVTGGAGFIGSHFILHMLKNYNNYNIINLDKLTYAANLKNLIEVENHKNYTFLKSDINDSSFLKKVFQEYDINIVVNFAAETHVDRSIKDPALFLKTNVMGTENLLRHSVKKGIQKFIQISTDEVYGSLGPIGFFNEKSHLNPNSPYAASKASADLLVRSYQKTYGLNINITRCTNNYGPHQHSEKLIPLIISRALQNNSIPVYGDGENIRDWLYVKDHCSAIDAVLHHGESGEIYNIGVNNEWKNIDLVRLILGYLGKSSKLIEYVDDRLGHDFRYAIDSSKIKTLGWEPKVEFEKGILNTINWFMSKVY